MDEKVFSERDICPRVVDFVLYYRPNPPLAVIEAKDGSHSIRSGIY